MLKNNLKNMTLLEQLRPSYETYLVKTIWIPKLTVCAAGLRMDDRVSSVLEPASSLPARHVRISRIAGRYLIFDIQDVAYLRRHQNISSIFVGTLPQNPTQNVFLGLPIELFAEEAKLLVERGVAYVVDDAAAHLSRLRGVEGEAKRRYTGAIRTKTEEANSIYRQEESRRQTRSEELRRKNVAKPRQKSKRTSIVEKENEGSPAEQENGRASDLLGPSPEMPPASPRPTSSAAPRPQIHLTPTTSAPLLSPMDDLDHAVVQVGAPESYHLYAHLNARGYYMIPGLRFGGHYSVYPGDPFRYHAHFLALSLGWDEPFPLLDLVARGRLGTSVKKGFLIGGRQPPGDGGAGGTAASFNREAQGQKESGAPGSDVRAFCIEWAAM
jgi:tRNA-splicing endonuclease subunit Sen34